MCALRHRDRFEPFFCAFAVLAPLHVLVPLHLLAVEPHPHLAHRPRPKAAARVPTPRVCCLLAARVEHRHHVLADADPRRMRRRLEPPHLLQSYAPAVLEACRTCELRLSFPGPDPLGLGRLTLAPLAAKCPCHEPLEVHCCPRQLLADEIDPAPPENRGPEQPRRAPSTRVEWELPRSRTTR